MASEYIMEKTMTDDIGAIFREVTAKIPELCVRKGLEPPFAIIATDQTGFEVFGLFLRDPKDGHDLPPRLVPSARLVS